MHFIGRYSGRSHTEMVFQSLCFGLQERKMGNGRESDVIEDEECRRLLASGQSASDRVRIRREGKSLLYEGLRGG